MSLAKTVVKGLSTTSIIGGSVGGPLGSELAKRDSVITHQDGILAEKAVLIKDMEIKIEKDKISMQEKDETIENYESNIGDLNEQIVKANEHLYYTHQSTKAKIFVPDSFEQVLKMYQDNKDWKCQYLDDTKFPETSKAQKVFRCSTAVLNVLGKELKNGKTYLEWGTKYAAWVTEKIKEGEKCSDHNCAKKIFSELMNGATRITVIDF